MQDSTDLQAAVYEKGQNEPYIIIYVWELLMAILCDIDEHNIPFVLMSAYFVFNINFVTKRLS